MSQHKTRHQIGRDFLREIVALEPDNKKGLVDLQQRFDKFLSEGNPGRARMESRMAEITELDADLMPLLHDMRVEQKMSLRRICDALAGKKIASRYGGSHWHPSTVLKILQRNGLK